MAPLRGPAVPRRRLGAELRRLREEAGATLEQAAAHLECSTSKISRLETGKGIPRIRDVRDLVDLYQVHDQRLRDRLARWVREGQQQGWWHDYADVMYDKSETFVSLEADAEAMYAYETTVVHGLLQTPAYTRAIGEVLFTDPTQVELDKFVELRSLRQHRVFSREEGPLRLHVIMEEPVIYRPVGGPQVMRGQLERLIEMADHPAVTIQVLPLDVGAHQAMGNAFVLLTFADPDPGQEGVIYAEGVGGATILDHERGVTQYRAAFDGISRRALDLRKSVSFITDMLRGED